MRITSLAVLVFLTIYSAQTIAHASENSDNSPGFFDSMERATRYLTGRSSSKVSYPYLRGAKYSYDSHANDEWSPEDWVEAEGDERKVIDRFYDSGLIVDQSEENGPILSVGDLFLRLSPKDQYRVATFIDYAFKMTEKEAGGVYQIFHHNQPVGLYSKHGLQMR